jgi:tetraacyldisaccharide 4'-kinase
MRPVAWVEVGSGRERPVVAPPFTRVGAFCGLGNPQSFRRTLANLGIEPVSWVAFDDHHRYRPHELRRMAHHFAAQGATAAVTTQKDAVNIGEGYAELLAPLPLYWLRVRMAIKREAGFIDEVLRSAEPVRN